MPIPIDINLLIHKCASNVAPKTMYAIIKTESRGNSLAINVNGGKRLKYQPVNYKQAVAWVNYLEVRNYNIDIGLAQVNIKNVHKFGYKARDMLEPCTNLKLASYILRKNYVSAYTNLKDKNQALLYAISAYNTGNYYNGFYNGYVNKVVVNGLSID